MRLDQEIRIGQVKVNNRLVMPPMQTNKTDHGHVTEELVRYYRERAVMSRPGIIITEHSCIAESGRAAEGQLTIASDESVVEHRRLTDAIHEGGSKAFVQLNHAGSNGIGESVSASAANMLNSLRLRSINPPLVHLLNGKRRSFPDDNITELNACQGFVFSFRISRAEYERI